MQILVDARLISCKQNVNKFDHLCFVCPFKLEEVLKEQEGKIKGLFLFLDMECLREDSRRLVANLIVIQDELGDEWVFKGLEALPQFSHSLFSEEGKLHRQSLGISKFVRAQRLALRLLPHNNGAGEIHRQRPYGSAIVQIKIFGGRVIFMDALQFLTMRLKDMPKTFGVAGSEERFFPLQVVQVMIRAAHSK